MKIKQCLIENFTVFQKQEIEFCPGINVIIGANGTGKSHLLKILYAMTQSITGEKSVPDKNKYPVKPQNLLIGLFKPEEGEIASLISNRANNVVSDITINESSRVHSIRIYSERKYNLYDPSTIAQWPNAKGIFIPPNEVLAIYPGFVASYEKRELAFDQTYYDICKALAAAPLKKKSQILSCLITELESILNGKVIQKGDRFYVQDNNNDRSLEAHLLAEGHRKIATLVHLINNGSIDKNTILFWDEPEANMNPRLIQHIANLLRKLANYGVQIFIATHDYLLTGELSLAAEYNREPKAPVHFYAMSREKDNPVQIQNGETLADLPDNPILDEFAAHYNREQDEIVRQMKRGAM